MRSLARRFAQDRRGAGAVEFALVAPLLLTIYLGCSEATIAFALTSKTQSATSVVNNLVSRAKTLSGAELTNAIGLARLVMVPYDQGPLTMRVSAIDIDGSGNVSLRWTCGTAGAAVATLTVPAKLSTLRSVTLVKTEAHYAYRPFGGVVWKGTVDLNGTAFINPRYSQTIDSPGC